MLKNGLARSFANGFKEPFRMMRKAIGWTLSWALFWIGHWISIPLTSKGIDKVPEWCASLLYRTYSWLMGVSASVQDWGGVEPGVGPWGPFIKGEE